MLPGCRGASKSCGLMRENGGNPPQGHRGRGGRGLSSAGAAGSKNGPTAKAGSGPPLRTSGDQFCIVVVEGDFAVLQRGSPTVGQFVDSFVATYNREDHQLAVEPSFEIRQKDIGQVMSELQTRITTSGMPKLCLLFAGGNNLHAYKLRVRENYSAMFVTVVNEQKLGQPHYITEAVRFLFRNLRISEDNQTSSTTSSRQQQASGVQRTITQPMPWKAVDQLCTDLDEGKLKAGSADLIERLLADGSFLKRLSNTATARPENLFALVRLVTAVCPCTMVEVRPSILQILTEVILSGLLRSVYDEFVTPMRLLFAMSDKEREQGCRTAVNLAVIAAALIDLLPSNLKSRKLFSLVADLQQLTDVGQEFELAKNRLTVKMNASIQQVVENRKGTGKSTDLQPPENFRQLSIIPIREDILTVERPYLRKNKTQGAYDNSEHYLDVQFRLLREDCLRGMRDGIKQISISNKTDNHGGDLMVYEQVRIFRHYVDSKRGAVVHPVDFRPKPHVCWSKEMLKQGSLVYLSNDGFRQSLIFAVVFDRFAEAGHIVLKFENAMAIDFKSVYQMVENPAYFEAYRHMLQGLQDVPPGTNVPFHRYLVENQASSVLPPKYLRQNPLLDFSPLLLGYKPTELLSSIAAKVAAAKKSVKNLDSYYSPKSFQMDESQFAALRTVLNNEVAVIQGPPGTGKTWIGYKIVKLLLANEHVWKQQGNHQQGKGPILIVGYTNHALDQFLEGIADMTQEIVRCGGGSESEKLEPFLIRNVRMKKKKQLGLGDSVYKIKKEGEEIEKQLQATMAPIIRAQRNLPSWLEIEEHVHIGAHKSALNQRFTDWLTTIGCPLDYPKELFNPSIIRELMTSWELDEMSSRVAAYESGNRSVEGVINYLHSLAALDDGADAHTIMALLPYCPQVEHLPRIAAIDTLMATVNCTEDNAIVALVRAENDVRKAAEMIRAEFGGMLSNAPCVAEGDDDVAHQNVARTNDLGRYIEVEDVAKRWQIAAAPTYDEQWAVVGRNGRALRTTETAFTQQLVNRILCAQPLADVEEQAINDIWGLPLHRRWRLFALWLGRYKGMLEHECGKWERRYIRLLKRLDEIYFDADYRTLQTAKIIGMTTTGAGKLQETLRRLKPPIVIVEEAAELFEASVLTSITQDCEHLILIGDHKQLRPKPAVYQLEMEYNLDVSLFERLVNNGFPYAQLTLQHRMRPQIRQTLMTHFYADLKDHESVSKYPDVMGMGGNLLLFNHSSPEEYSHGNATSPLNMLEARFSVVLALYLLQQNYAPEKITILCGYKEQMQRISKFIDETVGQLSTKDPNPIHILLLKVSVKVIDNYQGEENDIIILSLVRSNTGGKIGFVSVENRVCVALSRARHGLFIFGDFNHLSDCVHDGSVDGRTNWPGIVASAKEGGFMVEQLPIVCKSHGKEQKITLPTDFAKLSPEGGCLDMCGGQLGCEHPCEKFCHAYSHERVACLKPCERVCKDEKLKHLCPKVCYKDCGNCLVWVERELKCGHSQREPCYKEEKFIKCMSLCGKGLECGHKCKNICGADSCTTVCQELVTKALPCGHSVKAFCSTQVDDLPRCREEVTKLWRVCDHQLEVECYVDPEKSPCPSPCATLLPCGHVCKGKCGACFGGRLHIRCAERCKRMLVCGHACRSDCSQTCPPCEQRRENACAHSICRKKIFGQPNRYSSHPCPSCVQPCANRCDHRQCELACGEVCNVGFCNERCPKMLACGHQCVGMCGDICPSTKVQDGSHSLTIDYCRECVECEQKCGVCRPCRSFKAFQQLNDIFYGTETDKELMFVQLPDCNHVFESTGLDKLIKEPVAIRSEDNGMVDGYKIMMPSCPQCTTPIRRSIRYARYINRSHNLIEKVKSKVRGDGPLALDGQRNVLKMELIKQLPTQTDDKRIPGRERVHKEVVYNVVENLAFQLLGKVKICDPKHLTQEKLQSWQNVYRILTELKKRHNEYKLVKDFAESSSNVGLPNINVASAFLTPKGQSFCALRLLADEWEKLMVRLRETNLSGALSNLLIQQLTAELCRLRHLTQFCTWLHGLMTKNQDVKTTACLAAVWKVFFGSDSIQNMVQDELLVSIKACVDGAYLPASEQIELTKPIGMSHDQWYHCKNEHVYVIDQSVQAVCPECVTD